MVQFILEHPIRSMPLDCASPTLGYDAFMNAFRIGLIALLLALSGCKGCSEEKAPELDPRFVLPGVEQPKATPEEESATVENVAPVKDPDSVAITVAPDTLRVYRANTVSLKVQGIPTNSPVDSITWSFEDGTADASGASITHTFEGGLSAQKVHLKVKMSSGKLLEATHTIPLDRLPTGTVEAPKENNKPPEPLSKATALRVVFVGMMRLDPSLKDLAAKVFELRPQVLVILGEHLPPKDDPNSGRQWQVLEDAFLKPAKRRGVHVLATPGGADFVGSRATKSRVFWRRHTPNLDLLPGSDYPENYSLRLNKVFITTVRSNVDSMKDEIKRVESTLSDLKVDEFGLVLSHLPPAPWTRDDLGHLPKAYRLYEGLIRRNVRMMATGHYGVTYLARYGALKVVSGGRLNVPCNTLPDGTCTPPSVVVLDVDNGKLARTFAVDLDTPMQVIPASEFPEKLPFYERWEP